MGVFTLITLFFSMILQVIIPFIPAELIVIASGKFNGVFLTTIFAGSGLFIGSIIVYHIGYYIQYKFTKFFKKDKIKLVIQRLKEYETQLLLVRILPYNPSDIISYVSGIIKISRRKFFIITFFVAFIRTYILAVMGSYITNFKTAFFVMSLLIICAILTYSFVYKKPN
jgi:uncharacterized membrane protein YdjX (TVP38/TMEM64 family)